MDPVDDERDLVCKGGEEYVVKDLGDDYHDEIMTKLEEEFKDESGRLEVERAKDVLTLDLAFRIGPYDFVFCSDQEPSFTTAFNGLSRTHDVDVAVVRAGFKNL